MARIMLWGYYGTNYGDNISMDVLVRHLAKDHEVILASRFTPMRDIADRYNLPYAELLRGKASVMERLRFFCRWRKCIHLWGGGTSFTNHEGCGNADPFLWLSIIGAKYGYVGIGIDNLNNRKRLSIAKIMLRRCEFAIFREEQSAELANRYARSSRKNFTVGEDIVYGYLAERQRVETKESKPYVLICPRRLAHIFGTERETAIINAMVTASVEICHQLGIKHTKVLSTDVVEDAELTDIIANKIQSNGICAEVFSTTDVESITALITNAKLTLSARLHVSMVSEFLGSNTVSLSYSDKIIRLYESLPYRDCIDLYKVTDNLDKAIVSKALQERVVNNDEMNALLHSRAARVNEMMHNLSHRLLEESN